MRETAKQAEVGDEQSRLKDISERLGSNVENFSATQADQKLAERLGCAAPVEYCAEKLDKETVALKKEINETLAERYNTTPEFEELRSKSKINRLTTLEKVRYAYLSRQYPERAKISSAEQRRINLYYEDAKRNGLDFQIVEALSFYKREYEDAQGRGTSLNPRESDLYDKLKAVRVAKIVDRADEAAVRAEELLMRM